MKSFDRLRTFDRANPEHGRQINQHYRNTDHYYCRNYRPSSLCDPDTHSLPEFVLRHQQGYQIRTIYTLCPALMCGRQEAAVAIKGWRGSSMDGTSPCWLPHYIVRRVLLKYAPYIIIIKLLPTRMNQPRLKKWQILSRGC